MSYVEYPVHLTDAQRKSIAAAISAKTSVKLKMLHPQLDPAKANAKLYLTQTQANKFARMSTAGKGFMLTLTKKQLGEMRRGGFLPMLLAGVASALAPAIFERLVPRKPDPAPAAPEPPPPPRIIYRDRPRRKKYEEEDQEGDGMDGSGCGCNECGEMHDHIHPSGHGIYAGGLMLPGGHGVQNYPEGVRSGGTLMKPHKAPKVGRKLENPKLSKYSGLVGDIVPASSTYQVTGDSTSYLPDAPMNIVSPGPMYAFRGVHNLAGNPSLIKPLLAPAHKKKDRLTRLGASPKGSGMDGYINPTSETFQMLQ